MENKELWGVGKTFLLSILGLAMGFTLIMVGKIPADSFFTLFGTAGGLYTAKSIGHAYANKKGDKS